MSKMRTWRLFCRATLGLACLIFAGEAYAIELFRPIPLPDDGRGSIARAVIGGIVAFPNLHPVVGSKMNLNGMQVPMFWAANEFTNAVTGAELPLPMGAEGEAVGGLAYTSGHATFGSAVVGNVINNGIRWGVLWRKPAMGNWSMPQVLCQDADQSWVAGADYCGNGILAVAGSAFESGRWIAVLHLVSATDVVTVDLPTPPGSNSAALGLDCDMSEVAVGGWVTDQQGRERPVVWANSGQGFEIFPIDLPNGTQGRVNDVLRLDSGLAVCGDAMRAGRLMGFTATPQPLRQILSGIVSSHEEQHRFLEPLAGYADSSAESVLSASTLGRNVFGRSMNPGGEPVATGWLPFTPPFPAQQLLLDPGSVAEVRGFRPSDDFNTAVGQIVATPGGQPQACVFPATNAHVPDRISVPIGSMDNPHSPLQLWHRDDDNLRVRTQRSGGMQKAVVDLNFNPLFGPLMADSIQYNLIARAASFTFTDLRPGTYVVAGTLNVYAFNFANQTWVPVRAFPVTFTQDQIFTGDFNNDGVIDLQSGAVRLRLEFIADGNLAAALVCDMARILLIVHGGRRP